MLNFKELPKDGILFEQLIREIALRKDIHPIWTGKGPDSGRDLIFNETLSSKIKSSKKSWLVDCKHRAHSNNAVGVSDVVDIRDRCERINANGFLLATSTTVSSELLKKLDELEKQTGITTEIWDAVTLERFLLTPHSYSIAQQFFPNSLATPKWKMFYTEREERWMAHFQGNFLYVESRAGIDPPYLGDLEAIIAEIKKVSLGENEQLRIRAIWHDTPNGPIYTASADYLIPLEAPPYLKPSELLVQLEETCVDGGFVYWYVKPKVVITQSDYFTSDAPGHYGLYKQPLHNAFYEITSLDELAKYDSWSNLEPPSTHTFNDQALWNEYKSNFGFKKIGTLEVQEI